MKKYPGVTTRFLRDDERHFSTRENNLPLVIESNEKTSSVDAFKNFLSLNSKDILDDVATYGAVLFRGFNVGSTKEFEQTILAIRGLQGISHFFMSEPGRVLVDNLDYVFHTNSKIKTGGTLHLGGFHNENYYSPDVPSYIAFCCFNPAKMGGETGLINMRRVYEKLDDSLKEILEKKSFFVAKWPITVIASRYQIDLLDAKKYCSDFGLNIENDNFVAMHKPSVFKHPTIGKNILQANLCAEIPALNEEMLNLFIHDYKGWKWLIHKVAWKFLGYQKLRKLSFMLPELFRNPIKFFKMHKQMKQRRNQYSNNAYPRISSAFKPDEIKTLADHMHKSYASFLWQKGDILLIDNLQVAHAGMPGKTNKIFPRKIRAMLCNPFRIDYSQASPGLQSKGNLLPETLGEKMHKINIPLTNNF